MAYATVQDCIDRYGEDELWGIAGDDGEGNLNEAAIATALDDASEEIDSALRVRYALPLASVPGLLVRICIDLALAQVPGNAGEDAELLQNRAKAANTRLNEIARGVRQLDLADAPREPSTGDVLIHCPDSPFDPSKLRDM